MTRAVVDASVLVKLIIPEPDSELAERAVGGLTHILAPDLVWAELASVVQKRHRGRMLTTAQARRLIAAIRLIPVQSTPCSAVFEAAFELAAATGCTLYDGMYLAVALERDVPLITADAKLVNAVNG
ncbi:MAG: type II toxin-antitoxin system VapC family toxin [Phycisphaerales bacterium]|nr:type II toxin-antitoxin system VapC family toxin [Phycisphaerales bacterium]